MYAVLLLVNVLQIIPDQKKNTYFSEFFLRLPFLYGEPFLVCYSHRDLLRLGGPVDKNLATILIMKLSNLGEQNKYLLLMATPAKPDTVIQIVTSFSTSFLTARPTLDIFHADGAVSLRNVGQQASMRKFRRILSINLAAMLAARLFCA